MSDRGSTGLLLVVGVGLVAAAGVVMAALVAATWSHTAVESAADVTALAVAGRLLTDESPCAAGGAIAEANQAQLAKCQVAGNAATVEVQRDLPHLLSRLLPGRHATGTARAELRVDFPALPTH